MLPRPVRPLSLAPQGTASIFSNMPRSGGFFLCLSPAVIGIATKRTTASSSAFLFFISPPTVLTPGGSGGQVFPDLLLPRRVSILLWRRCDSRGLRCWHRAAANLLRRLHKHLRVLLQRLLNPG